MEVSSADFITGALVVATLFFVLPFVFAFLFHGFVRNYLIASFLVAVVTPVIYHIIYYFMGDSEEGMQGLVSLYIKTVPYSLIVGLIIGIPYKSSRRQNKG